MHGGVGHIGMPLLADTNQAMAKAYQVLKEDEGVAFRAQFIIDGKGIIRHIMINDFSVGRNVDETLRIVKGKKIVFLEKHRLLTTKSNLVFSSIFLSTYQYVQIKSAKFVMNHFQLTFFFWHFWKKIS